VKPHFLEPLLEGGVTGYELRHAQSGAVVAARIELAIDSTGRRRGLLGRASLPSGDALVIAPCGGIHTFFMRFPIDVAFVDRQGKLVGVHKYLKPWRIALSLSAFAVVELSAGALDRAQLAQGDRLALWLPRTG
jgi:uncharacterized membrane protein (UPF0127 family)